MASASALAGLVIASAGVGLQWLRFWRGEDISEPLRLPTVICPACPPRFEALVPERRLFLLDFAISPGFWLELVIGYVIGLHLVLGLLLCRYGRRWCCASPSRRRVGIRSRIEGAIPAGSAIAGELRDGPGLAPREGPVGARH